MVEEKDVEEFRNTGLLLIINQLLHVFGWAIVVEANETGEQDYRMYPARVKFRGFAEKSTDKAYIKISKYMKEHGEELYDEAIENE